jgi:hypothetical protein
MISAILINEVTVMVAAVIVTMIVVVVTVRGHVPHVVDPVPLHVAAMNAMLVRIVVIHVLALVNLS